MPLTETSINVPLCSVFMRLAGGNFGFGGGAMQKKNLFRETNLRFAKTSQRRGRASYPTFESKPNHHIWKKLSAVHTPCSDAAWQMGRTPLYEKCNRRFHLILHLFYSLNELPVKTNGDISFHKNTLKRKWLCRAGASSLYFLQIPSSLFASYAQIHFHFQFSSR